MSPNAYTTNETLQKLWSPTISSTIWEITTVLNCLKKKKNIISKKLRPLPFNHNVCHFHVLVCCRCLLASPSADVKSLRCVAAASVLQRWEGVWWSVRWVVGSGNFYPRYQDCKRERRSVSPVPSFPRFPKGSGHRRQPPPPRGGLIETVTNRPNYKA